MKIRWRFLPTALAALTLLGCGTVYSWRPAVPADRRTVAVPTFRNSAKLPGFGSVMARQLAREFQREGTFAIESAEAAAALVQVTVVDRRSQKLLLDNRKYDASVTYSAGADSLNAKRDASGRLADELSRRVVDDILNLKW